MRAGPLDRTGGIILNLTGQVMQNLAAVLMSFGQQGPLSAKRRSLWYVGVVLIVLGALAVFASYGVAEQSLLGSLISVQFVSNMFFCRVILGKSVTLFMLVGTAVIVGGTLLCILNAPHVEHDLDEAEMERLYLRNPVFQRFLLGEAMVWILMDKLYSTYVDAQQRGHQKWGHEVLIPCMFVARAALPGSFSVVAAKNLAVLLRLTTEGRNMLGSPLLWLSLFFWLGGTAYWMRRMNHALALFNGAFIIPLCQVNWSCFTIVTGGVFFEEFKYFSWDNSLLFALGVCVNFAGVMMLQPPKKTSKVKDPDCGQTCPEETPVEAGEEQCAQMAALNSPYPPYPIRSRGRSVSKSSNCSGGSLSLISSASSPCPDLSARERKPPRLNTVGLIPLVLDGVQEERTESGPSSERNSLAVPANQGLMDRLAKLEEASMEQHILVLGKLNEVISALHLSKGVQPVPTMSSDTGTPLASGLSTPQPVPPEAPLPPSTPPPPLGPLSMLPSEGPGSDPCGEASLPVAQEPSTPPRVAPSPRPAGFSSPAAAHSPPPSQQSPPPVQSVSFPARALPSPPAESPRGVGSPPPPDTGPHSLPAIRPSPPAAEGHLPHAVAGVTFSPLAESSSPPLGRPCVALPSVPLATPQEMPPVPMLVPEPTQMAGRQVQLEPITLGKSGRSLPAVGRDRVPAERAPAAQRDCSLLLNSEGGVEEAGMPGA
mmetsp:Transcript_9307/g.26153  ORF Transcript_9307/g.26153 Transcript_9307/m.26153 type:complete len:711 (+) Transcript_9307:78-2210(+)